MCLDTGGLAGAAGSVHDLSVLQYKNRIYFYFGKALYTCQPPDRVARPAFLAVRRNLLGWNRRRF
jgi:hypothetical protein